MATVDRMVDSLMLVVGRSILTDQMGGGGYDVFQ
jgi:hypothetical protein